MKNELVLFVSNLPANMATIRNEIVQGKSSVDHHLDAIMRHPNSEHAIAAFHPEEVGNIVLASPVVFQSLGKGTLDFSAYMVEIPFRDAMDRIADFHARKGVGVPANLIQSGERWYRALPLQVTGQLSSAVALILDAAEASDEWKAKCLLELGLAMVAGAILVNAMNAAVDRTDMDEEDISGRAEKSASLREEIFGLLSRVEQSALKDEKEVTLRVITNWPEEQPIERELDDEALDPAPVTLEEEHLPADGLAVRLQHFMFELDGRLSCSLNEICDEVTNMHLERNQAYQSSMADLRQQAEELNADGANLDALLRMDLDEVDQLLATTAKKG